MKFSKYLKDNLVNIIIYIATVVLLAFILVAFKVQNQAIIITLIVLVFSSLVILLNNFFRKNKFYEQFCRNLEKLDKKFLILETLPEPNTYEEKIMVDSLYEINKSMLENINEYQKNINEFKEFVEIWIHEVKIPISSMVLKCHKIYYKNLNAFVFKQISSKINTMVISISVICIMLFITLCLLSSAFTIKNYFNRSINKYAPVDFEIRGYYDDEVKDINLKDFIEKEEVIKNNTKDITIVDSYYDANFTYGKSLGNYEDDVRKKYPYVSYNSEVEIMGETDYNKLAQIMNFETVDLKEDEYVIVSNYEADIYKEVVRRNSIINIFGNELKPHGNVIDGFIMISANPSNLGFFVVDDSIIKSENKNWQMLVGNYSTEDETTIEVIENKISNYTPGFAVMKNTKLEIKEAAVGISVIVTFIGLYLGIIFLISSSAILALKELSDCIDDKNKYRVLRQIGADEKEINKALFKQTLMFFMMPLSLAIVHTIFGLKFCTFLLKSLGIGSALEGSIVTFLFLIAIYGIYFVVTYLCSRNIIKE